MSERYSFCKTTLSILKAMTGYRRWRCFSPFLKHILGPGRFLIAIHGPGLTLVMSAADDGFEPILTDAADGTNVRYGLRNFMTCSRDKSVAAIFLGKSVSTLALLSYCANESGAECRRKNRAPTTISWRLMIRAFE
ncbi:hypothetical protein N4R57_04310 [Rhodobacteraceae bacterium D3-12]|nr:hypothetical protein N4R57_04310 [Rhodobacteraceae bacterium D3-12]